MIKGIVFGLLWKYKLQNSKNDNFIKLAILLYQRLITQGWKRPILCKIFLQAYENLSRNSKTQKEKEISNKECLILHWQYHPQDLPHNVIWKIYNKHCAPLFDQPSHDGGLGIK